MRLGYLTYGSWIAITGFCSCVKPFSPKVSTVNQNYLVVEGFINTGGDTTKYVLSRTVLINSKTTSVPETGAIVTVEDAAGNSYALPESTTKGIYISKGALTLTSGTQYRLRIKALTGKTYLSDLVDSKISPPIDSIGYLNGPGVMQLYVSTHDNVGKTIYYKYSFSEAWEFHAEYQSAYFYNGKAVVMRTPAQDVYYCYNHDSSTNIGLTSTAALSKDQVYQFVINTIPQSSEKIELKYSILASQQALTKDGYTFWSNLKKNTEDLGSIFDAQPSSLTGNIHNINDASEPVIGFISAGTIQKKRIYINHNTLPANYVTIYPYLCDFGYATTQSPPPLPYTFASILMSVPSPFRIIGVDSSNMGYTNYTYTSDVCGDCTLRGTHNPPVFWKP